MYTAKGLIVPEILTWRC